VDALVVGGGIGGSVLAGLLARAGKRVLVLERSLGPPSWTRPEIYWPTTAEFLANLLPSGVWEREAALQIRGFDIHDGRRARPLVPEESLRLAGVRPSSAEPNRLRELLLEHRRFELRRGVEVLSLLRDGPRVRGVRARDAASGGELELEADLVVGDDGAHSVVRGAAGVPIRLATFPIDFLCFGPRWPRGLPEAHVRLWVNRGKTRSGILGLGVVPLPDGAATGLLLARPGAEEDPRAREAWPRFLEIDPLLAEVVAGRSFPGDFALVRRDWGHAESYGAPGVVLLGDAAHPVSPAGGQGASAAVADARALAEIVLGGSADPAGDLEKRRRAPNERSLAITRLVDRVWRMPAILRPTPLFFAGLAFLRARPSLLARMVRDVSTRFLDPSRATP